MKRRNFLRYTASGILATAFSPLAIHEFTSIPDRFIAGNDTIKRFGDGRDWFFEKRFGMFIHWGLYAIPAWHEQYQWRAKVERSQYMQLAGQWNPKKFNPEKWLDIMQEGGMKYICFTTKHHDGFCMWDTKYTSFNVMNTPYKRDILGMLADACHKRNIPLSLYYSIADWNHPKYPNEGRHHELPPQKGDNPNWLEYLEFLKAQVRELCTNYGKINGFWWDMNVPEHKDPAINDMIRKLQPDAVINNRGFDEGDFGTPERDFQKDDIIAFTRPTEACQSIGIESWGYRSDEDYYTDRHLLRSIDRYLCRDANYLLNIGPTAEGIISTENEAILKRIGKWYRSVKESLEDVQPASQYTANRNIMLTQRNNTVYVHLNKDQQGNSVKLPPLKKRPVKATLLNDGRRIETIVNLTPTDHVSQQPVLRLRDLPANEMANTVMVVKLDFDTLPWEK
ncbi:MAG: alpha-L-fucosidase [Bacteroidales bacterium]|jgi:alpha-L-fucosidase|nr:alpha-L-fucosidase [Bacteroidales bacterium]